MNWLQIIGKAVVVSVVCFVTTELLKAGKDVYKDKKKEDLQKKAENRLIQVKGEVH